MKKDDGGQFHMKQGGETFYGEDGISRRDWLAGLAMQGVCVGYFKDVLEDNPNYNIDKYQRMIAKTSYEIADAMIRKEKE